MTLGTILAFQFKAVAKAIAEKAGKKQNNEKKEGRHSSS